MTNRATRDLPSDLRVQDNLEILDIHEAPMCEACGWSGSDLGKCQSARLIPPKIHKLISQTSWMTLSRAYREGQDRKDT